jgi:hypothetical protein
VGGETPDARTQHHQIEISGRRLAAREGVTQMRSTVKRLAVLGALVTLLGVAAPATSP